MNTPNKILIIEDDKFLREFYQELLQEEGYFVDIAVDGETAVSKLENGGFNLILLDIMLPKKDGIQVLKEMALKTPKNSNGPVVVLSNLGQDSVIKKCYELGASGYLIKSSLNPDQVLAQIHNYLRNNG